MERATVGKFLGVVSGESVIIGMVTEISEQAGTRAHNWALRTALEKETDDGARRAMVRALITSGERSERLTELLQSKDPKVREAAIRGIAGKGGVDPWPWPEPRPRPFP